MDYVWDAAYAVGITSNPSLASIPIFPKECQRDIYHFYEIDPEIIGEGSFASIRRVKLRRLDNDNGNDTTTYNRYYACKTIPKTFGNRELILEEVYNLNRCQATNIDNNYCVIRLLDVLEDRYAVHLITELCEGGELHDYISKEHDRAGMGLRGKALSADSKFGIFEKDESRCALIIQQILIAFAHLHDTAHVCHRDAKASNFVFLKTPSYIKGSLELRMVDFGLSAFVGKEEHDYRKTRPATNNGGIVSSNKSNDALVTSIWDAIQTVYGSATERDDETIKHKEEIDATKLDSKGNRYMTSEVGTPYYVAPEVLKQGQNDDIGYTTQCDIWSVGVLAFLTLTGDFPVMGEDEKETVQKLMNPNLEIDFSDASVWEQSEDDVDEYDPKKRPRISNAARIFCKALLQVDPTQRPTAREALGFDWITQHCEESALLSSNDETAQHKQQPCRLPSLSASTLEENRG